eukprot:m.97764 g.97764  ORF g.97764 m.97764 type:complete len:216 (-) comp16727_c0_seq7:87-734(-)
MSMSMLRTAVSRSSVVVRHCLTNNVQNVRTPSYVGTTTRRWLAASTGQVKVVTSYDELTTLVSENKKTGKTVYWTATWCGPCKQISPEFEKLAKEYEEMDFAKVDIDEVSDAAKSAGITSVPTFQFFKHGHFLGQFSGADVDKLKSYVRQVDDLDEETLQNTVAARQAQEANEKSIIACISVCVRTFCLRVCLRPRHVLFPQSISTWSYCAWHSV